uniref:Uncharacterized protein n=1 Tax=Glossina austeni TaxID=7395 RepID=A0A1A9UIE4_GLOAU
MYKAHRYYKENIRLIMIAHDERTKSNIGNVVCTRRTSRKNLLFFEVFRGCFHRWQRKCILFAFDNQRNCSEISKKLQHSVSLVSINETTSLTLPSYYSSSYTSLPSSSSSSSSSSLANAMALRLNGNPGNVNSNRSRLFAGTSNNATIVTAIALKSTVPTKIANSISNSNNYDPSNSTISTALGSISLSNVNGNNTKTINNSSSSRSSSSSSSSSSSNIVTRVSARKVDSKYTLPKSHKTDAPMLNYIFDTFSSANKHHHHDQRWVNERVVYAKHTKQMSVARLHLD